MYGVGAAVTLLGKHEDQITKAGHNYRLIDADNIESIDLRVMTDIEGPPSCARVLLEI